MVAEIIKFIVYSLIIVIISKYILVKLLRKIGESLSLSAKIVGEISGFATSIPELLTVCFSALSGLIGTSIYNILSSNIINFIQYGLSLKMLDNNKYLKSKLIRLDLFFVIITIIIPMLLVFVNLELRVNIVLLFILLFILFYRTSYIAHQKYGKKIEKTKENGRKNNKIFFVIKYFIYLILVGIILFIIGKKLSYVLESLSMRFRIPEFILGIALGFITSIPELITFFESQKYHTENEESNDESGVIEATNNLLFSNMFNLFIIQSLGILIYAAVIL